MMDDFDIQQSQQLQRQKMAQMLMQNAMQPAQGQMAGRVFVGNPAGALGNVLQGYMGNKMGEDATKQLSSIADQKRQRTADLLKQGFDALKSGDQQGAAQIFAGSEDTTPYAQEIFKGQIAQQNAQNKPVDPSDIAKFDPASFAVYQKTKNPADLKLANTVDPYRQQALDLQKAQIDLQRSQLNQGQWQLDHDALGNPIRVNKVTGETQPIKTEGAAGATDLTNMIDGIGTGKIAPPSSLALRNPKVLQMMDMVMQKYPDYDGTIYATRQSAQKSWAPGGKSGDTYRAIGTANKHLDMVSTLVDALDNRDTQVLNKIGNEYTKQTGNPAPTNFDAAKNIVGQEVVKAIVANGGGVAEREEAAKLLDKAQSPAQLKGVINTYRTIMDAQKESLLQQRRAAGLSDKSLPDYTEGSGQPAATPKRLKFNPATGELE